MGSNYICVWSYLWVSDNRLNLNIIKFIFYLVSNFLIQLIRDDFGWKSSDWNCDSYDCGIRDIMIVAVTFIVLPLSLKRNFYAFRHVTIIGVCSILYAIFVVLGESFKKQDRADSDIKMGYAHFDLNLFTGYTSALFSFTCYTVVFPIRMELNNPIEKRITKVNNYLYLIKIFQLLDFQSICNG